MYYLACLELHAHPNVPDAGTVEEKGVSFSNLSDVSQVPDVETVIIVHHCYLDGVST